MLATICRRWPLILVVLIGALAANALMIVEVSLRSQAAEPGHRGRAFPIGINRAGIELALSGPLPEAVGNPHDILVTRLGYPIGWLERPGIGGWEKANVMVKSKPSFAQGSILYAFPPPKTRQVFYPDDQVLWYGLALSVVTNAAVLSLPFVLFCLWRRWWRRTRGRCIACAYDLTGAAHERCPECGREVTSRTSPATCSDIAPIHRREH